MSVADYAEKSRGMTGEPLLGPTILERLDLAVAGRIAGLAGDTELLATAQRYQDRLYRKDSRDARFIAALLRLRGLLVLDDDAADVLLQQNSRLNSTSQEHAMIRGLGDALNMLRDRTGRGVPINGWFLAEVFRVVTRNIPRFRSNTLRRDQPWDAILYVHYPIPEELNYLLDTFDPAHSYRDFAKLFTAMHPVRQAFRILWRLARIAPFPDFNLLMGWLAMCGHLLANGYPVLLPEPQDQGLLHRLVGGPPPQKVVQFEARLLDSIDSM
jgi:hypothetical protein